MDYAILSLGIWYTLLLWVKRAERAGELSVISFGDLVSILPYVSYVCTVSILSYILNSLYRLVFVVLAELFLLYVSDLV